MVRFKKLTLPTTVITVYEYDITETAVVVVNNYTLRS